MGLLIFPSFTRKHPSRVTPVITPVCGSSTVGFEKLLTYTPSLQLAIISSIVAVCVPGAGVNRIECGVLAGCRRWEFAGAGPQARFFNTPRSIHVWPNIG